MNEGKIKLEGEDLQIQKQSSEASIVGDADTTKPVTPTDEPTSENINTLEAIGTAAIEGEKTAGSPAPNDEANNNVLNEVNIEIPPSLKKFDLSAKQQGVPLDLAEEIANSPMSFKEPLSEPKPIVEANSSSDNESPLDASMEEEKVNFADMWVWTMDMAVSSVCSVISGDEKENFKLSEKERTEYKKVSASYFKTVDFDLSPSALFAISSLTIFGGSIVGAVSIKRQKNKEKKALAAEKKAQAKDMELLHKHLSALKPILEESVAEEVIDVEKIEEEETPEETKEETPKRLRTRFDVNKKTGFYIYDESTNSKLKVDDQVEKPTPEIQALLDAKKSNRQIQIAIYGKVLGRQNKSSNAKG